MNLKAINWLNLIPVKVIVVEEVVQDGAALEHGDVAVDESGHLPVGVGCQELLGLIRPVGKISVSVTSQPFVAGNKLLNNHKLAKQPWSKRFHSLT